MHMSRWPRCEGLVRGANAPVTQSIRLSAIFGHCDHIVTNFQLRTFLRRCSCADFFHDSVEYISSSLPARYYGVQSPGGQDIRGDRNGGVTDVMVGDSNSQRGFV